MIWTPERQSLAMAEIARWRGVPHRDRMAVHPVGIDCIHLVAEIYFAAGIVERTSLPDYRTQIGLYHESSALQEMIALRVKVERVHGESEFGDIAIMKTKGQSAHCGFVTGKKLAHSLARHGVVVSPWQQWQHRVACILRLTGLGYRH